MEEKQTNNEQLSDFSKRGFFTVVVKGSDKNGSYFYQSPGHDNDVNALSPSKNVFCFPMNELVVDSRPWKPHMPFNSTELQHIWICTLEDLHHHCREMNGRWICRALLPQGTLFESDDDQKIITNQVILVEPIEIKDFYFGTNPIVPYPDAEWALEWASETGDLDLVKSLLSHHIELNPSNAFFSAALHGHLPVIKHFLDNFQVPNPSQIQIALHLAIPRGHFLVVKYFLDNFQIDLSAQNDLCLELAKQHREQTGDNGLLTYLLEQKKRKDSTPNSGVSRFPMVSFLEDSRIC